MTMLMLNVRALLHQLPVWFPDSAHELVVLSHPNAVAGLDAAAREDLARRFRHLEVVERYRGDDLMRRAGELCTEHDVTHVLTVSESDITRAAELRQRFGIPGQDVASATAYRDKFVMKTLVGAAGVPVARMRMVHTAGELDAAADELGYPLVVKHPGGRGSMYQHVHDDPASVDRFVRQWQPAADSGGLLAEAWVHGDKLNVNGLMKDGKVVQLWPARYLHTPWNTRNANRHGAIGVLPETDPLFAPLCALTADVIAALPAPPGLHPFHAEFFHSDDGLVFCEIACRAGGMRIVETHELSYGVNLYEAGLKGQAGRDDEIEIRNSAERFGMVSFVPLVGFLHSVPRTCPLPNAIRYRVVGETGHRYSGAQTSNDEIASVILRQTDPDCLAELREATDWWDREVRWSA